MMTNERSMILAATPMEAAELRTIFSDRADGIRHLLEDPPRLRDSGWNLRTWAQAKFVRGELIRIDGGRMVADLYRDGTFLLGGQVDRNFLAWSDKADLRLHPLALVELTVSFTRFYGLVLKDFRAVPRTIEFRIELRNMHLAGHKTQLCGGPVGRPYTAGPVEAPEDTWGKDLAVLSEGYNPDQVAFSLLRELYLWFGHSEEAIPYSKDTEVGRVIAADQIAGIR